MTEIQQVKLDQIPELRAQIDELKAQRDRRVSRLIQGVGSWDEYLSLSAEVRGISMAIRSQFVIRD